MNSDNNFLMNLHATNLETVSVALAEARQWTAEKDILAQPEQFHTLLMGLKAVIEQEEHFDWQLRFEAADVLEQIIGNHYELREQPFFADIINWYDDQMNYDDLVLAATNTHLIENIHADQASFLAELHSGDPARVSRALVEVDRWLAYHVWVGIPPVFGPIVLALKQILDNDTGLGDTVMAEVRALLVEQMWLNHRLIQNYSPELEALREWYLATDEYKTRSRL